jgi:hypothetical protein
MEDQAEGIARLVREDDELQARIDAEARATAHALIQGYLGPDHKVTNMQSFYSALVQALKEAREQGQADCRGNDVSTI